jgi:hypothetical protein
VLVAVPDALLGVKASAAENSRYSHIVSPEVNLGHCMLEAEPIAQLGQRL